MDDKSVIVEWTTKMGVLGENHTQFSDSNVKTVGLLRDILDDPDFLFVKVSLFKGS